MKTTFLTKISHNSENVLDLLINIHSVAEITSLYDFCKVCKRDFSETPRHFFCVMLRIFFFEVSQNMIILMTNESVTENTLFFTCNNATMIKESTIRDFLKVYKREFHDMPRHFCV